MINIFSPSLCHKEVLANQNFSEEKLQTQYGKNFQNQLVNVESFTIITTAITGNVNLKYFPSFATIRVMYPCTMHVCSLVRILSDYL